MEGSSKGQGCRTDVEDPETWEKAYFSTRRNLERRRKRIAWFGLGADARVLDLGCGDGLNTAILRERGVRVVGLDVSRDLLRLVEGGGVVAGDALRTPFRDGSFDAVLCDSILQFCDSREALREIFRLLKPGGALCVLEPRPSLARAAFDWVTRSPLSKCSRYLADRKTMIDELKTQEAWFEVLSDFPRILGALGFVRVFERKLPLGVAMEWRLAA